MCSRSDDTGMQSPNGRHSLRCHSDRDRDVLIANELNKEDNFNLRRAMFDEIVKGRENARVAAVRLLDKVNSGKEHIVGIRVVTSMDDVTNGSKDRVGLSHASLPSLEKRRIESTEARHFGPQVRKDSRVSSRIRARATVLTDKVGVNDARRENAHEDITDLVVGHDDLG